MTDDQRSNLNPSPASPPGEIATAPQLGVRDTEIPELRTRARWTFSSAHAEFAAFHEGYVGRYIALADTKAFWSFTIASGTLAYLLSKDPLRDILVYSAWTPEFVTLALPVAILAVSAACSFMVIVPRLYTTGEGYVFWGSVAKWKSSSDYIEQLSHRSADEITELRLRHCYDVAKVCARKYEFLRKAMWLGIIGLVSVLAPALVYG